MRNNSRLARRLATGGWAALLLSGCQLVTDTRSDLATKEADAEALVDRYYSQYQQPGFLIDDLLEFYTPDVAFIDPTYEIRLNGRSDFRQFYSELGTDKTNYRDIAWKIEDVLVDGDAVAIYGRWSGTFHHCPFDVAFTTFWRLDEGLIAEQRDYFAASAFDRQVGWDAESATAQCGD